MSGRLTKTRRFKPTSQGKDICQRSKKTGKESRVSFGIQNKPKS